MSYDYGPKVDPQVEKDATRLTRFIMFVVFASMIGGVLKFLEFFGAVS